MRRFNPCWWVYLFVLLGSDTIADVAYDQDVGLQVVTDAPVWDVAVLGDRVIAGFGDGLRELNTAGELLPMPGAPAGFTHRLEVAGGFLWVLMEEGIHRYDGRTWRMVDGGRATGVAHHNGRIVVSREDGLYSAEDNGLVALEGGVPGPGPIQNIAAHGETIYCLGYDRVFTFDGARYAFVNTVEFGAFPSKDLRDILDLGDRLLVGCHAGLGVLRGVAATQILGSDGLPFEEILALGKARPKEVWIGATRGAVRMRDGRFDAFSGPRWLPNDRVNGIAAGEEAVYLATNRGIAIMRRAPWTLEKKAAHYDGLMVATGQYDGRVVHRLVRESAAAPWHVAPDEGWVERSLPFWSAQAFRHAVTGDPEARKRAEAGFEALASRDVGEARSRTEIAAHFYFASLYHEHVAEGEERARVAGHVAGVMDRIIESGYVLPGGDGAASPRWDAEWVASAPGGGRAALEILSHLAVARALTGQDRFAAELERLAGQGYGERALFQKQTEPPEAIDHAGDALAFLCYYPLLRYEGDPVRRSLLRRGLARSFEIERIEHNPWFTFIHAAHTATDTDVEAALRHLREWPLDLARHDWDFTYQRDLLPESGYLPYTGGARAFSPRQRGPLAWTESPFEKRGGDGGLVCGDPSGWLEAYWMGRHHGIIAAP